MRTLLILLSLFAATILITRPERARQLAELPRGRQISDFTLCDHHGHAVSLSDFADKKLVVVVFLGTACPLAQHYAPILVDMAKEYEARGVAFLGINANDQDTLADVADYVRRHAIPFPVLKDADQAVADRFGATRTPEAFVMDESRFVRYFGRIDDGVAVGMRKSSTSRQELKDAVDDLLAGREVARPHVPAAGCLIGRRVVGTPSAPLPDGRGSDSATFQDVRPILERRCVGCHRPGEIGPFPLIEWKEVAAWSAMIREVVVEGRMPPWHADPRVGHFRNDTRLTAEEKRVILAWIDVGCPQGPPVVGQTFLSAIPDWGIPRPDQVFYIAEEPVRVPAKQETEYQYFLVDPGFRADKFIQAAEVRPGNRAVVHHALVSIVYPRQDAPSPPTPLPLGRGEHEGLPDSLGALLNYAPGMQPTQLPDGWAIHVPAGSKFLFQMHYTPNGKEQTDRSYLGLVFADPKKVKHKVRGGAVLNPNIDIPPNAKNHQEAAEHVFTNSVQLLSLSPHLHLRGKSFRIEAAYPDGRREILLDVPRYDFHWQLRYELAEPRRLPAGSRLICTAVYDNSADNPANPNPAQRVGWGDQTWDEMLIGFFAFVEEEKD
ncbi:MAG: redoxin domain-containing protein [Gemmataceae bacterium]|nr:redoxin domain-containing protein [Gemmataceae bacterium]MCI0739728.1 redoxin domain-containing protein [Gemmataceae bacterium]